MKNKLLKNKLIIVGAIIGGVAGYLYYSFIGCTSGGCMITSSPLISTLYGGLLGAFLLDSFRSKRAAIINE